MLDIQQTNFLSSPTLLILFKCLYNHTFILYRVLKTNILYEEPILLGRVVFLVYRKPLFIDQKL